MHNVPALLSFEEFEAQTLKLIAPPPFVSRFNAVQAHELFLPSREHEWLIDDLLVRGELSMIAGPSQSGKSFVAIAQALAIARGVPFFGRKVRQGLVLYQAGEGAVGLWKRRLPAYWRHHSLEEGEKLPFVLLPANIDLHASDESVDALIEEARHWGEVFAPVPLELIVIDTFSAATAGANENSSQDVSKILSRCGKLSAATNASVLVIHHLNANGDKARGHTSIHANLDSMAFVNLMERPDGDGRQMRRMTLAKLKDGESGGHIDFVLKSVAIGRDEEGKLKTSCVITPPSGVEECAVDAVKGRPTLPDAGRVVLMALDRALEKHGVEAPRELGLPSSIKRVCRGEHWRAEYAGLASDPDDTKTMARDIQRWGSRMLTTRIIGRVNPWVWRTGNTVVGETPREDERPQARIIPFVPKDAESPVEHSVNFNEDDAIDIMF